MKTKRDNLPLVIALVLFGLMVAVMLLVAVVRTRAAGGNARRVKQH